MCFRMRLKRAAWTCRVAGRGFPGPSTLNPQPSTLHPPPSTTTLISDKPFTLKQYLHGVAGRAPPGHVLPGARGHFHPYSEYSRANSYPWSPLPPEAGPSRTRSSHIKWCVPGRRNG